MTGAPAVEIIQLLQAWGKGDEAAPPVGSPKPAS